MRVRRPGSCRICPDPRSILLAELVSESEGPVYSGRVSHESRAVQGAYQDAWTERIRSGAADSGLLDNALSSHDVPPSWRPGGAARAVGGFLDPGVPPRRFRAALLRQLPGLVRKSLAPYGELRRVMRDAETVPGDEPDA